MGRLSAEQKAAVEATQGGPTAFVEAGPADTPAEGAEGPAVAATAVVAATEEAAPVAATGGEEAALQGEPEPEDERSALARIRRSYSSTNGGD